MGRLRRTREGASTNTKDIQDLLKLASDEGVEVEEPKQEVSLLNKIFGVLSAGETAPLAAALQEGKTLKEALKEQGKVSGQRITGKGMTEAPTYEDVLERAGVKEDSFAAKAGGLAGDILLDPTTYVGGAIAKGVGKKVLKPLAKAVSKTGKAGKILRKIPAVGKAISKGDEAVDLGKKLFDPLASLEKGGFKEGDKAKELLDVAIKGGRHEEGLAEEGLKGLITKDFAKIDDAGKTIGEAIETGTVDSLPDTLKPIGEYLQKGFKDMYGEEATEGLIKSNIDNYMAHVLTPEARKFFASAEGSFVPGKLNFGKGRSLEGSAIDANKAFRKRLEDAGEEVFDLFEEDALKAFTVRKKASIRALTHKGMVKQVENVFGKSADDLIAEGGKEFGKDIISLKGVKYKPIPGDALRFFSKDLDKFNKLGDPATVVGVAKTARKFVPLAIADELVNMNKLFINDEAVSQLARNYDKVLNTWKKSVTGIFPAFHGRNLMGGMFNNFIAGVKNPAKYIEGNKLALGVDELVKVGGKTLKIGGEEQTYKSLLDYMKRRGIVGGQGFLDVSATVDKTTDIAKLGKASIPRKIVEDLPMATMEAIETRLRGTLLLDSLSKGDDIAEATNKVFKFHFDYSPEAFTPFEREWARRVVPFYTWTRRNIPLQIEQMIQQPGKFSGVGKAGRTLEGDIDKEVLPEYIREGFVVDRGEKEGIPRMFYNLGLPVEDINKLNKADALSLVNPFIKAPVELATNKNFFLDKPLDEANRPPSGFEKLPKVLHKAVGYNEKSNTADPIRWHILTSLLGRGIFTASRLFAGSDAGADVGGATLEGLFGIRKQDLEGYRSVDKQKEARQKDLLKELQKDLKGKGLLYESSYYGVPK
jgi:hypothetical protein